MPLNVKRAKELQKIEQAVLNMAWKDIKLTPDDNQWRKYQNNFSFENESYTVSFFFKLDNQFFTYKQMLITYQTKTIQIPQDVRLH